VAKRNYRRGFVKEVRCVTDLRKDGFWAERLHASKGTFDVIAARDIIRFIQVKRSNTFIKSVKAIENAYIEDIEKMRKVPTADNLSIELWVWFDAKMKPKGICKSTEECPLHYALPHAMKEECAGCGFFKQKVVFKARWRKFDIYKDKIEEMEEWVI